MSSYIYLGWSFGAQFAETAVVLLCEAALGHPRAVVTLDIRKQYPIRATTNWNSVLEMKTELPEVFAAVPWAKVVVLHGSGH